MRPGNGYDTAMPPSRFIRAPRITTRVTAKITTRIATTIAVMMILLLLARVSWSAEDEAPYDYQLKTVYLFKFTSYVQWPPDTVPAGGVLHLCLFDHDPYPGAMSQARAAWHGEHPIQLKILAADEPPSNCQILFVPKGASVPEEDLHHRGTLTVGEGNGFLAQGGIIQFVTQNRTVSFEISLKAAQAAGLKISSALLHVARKVVE